MNKKFLSVILFGALMTATTSTFTSCKDYDDDIDNLQEQLDKKATAEDLNSKVSALESEIAAAKSSAECLKRISNQHFSNLMDISYIQIKTYNYTLSYF